MKDFKELREGAGLWANIRAKKARGEKMRAKGEKGAPTPDAIKQARNENTIDMLGSDGLDITEISLDMLTKKISNTKGRENRRKANKIDKLKTDLAKLKTGLNKGMKPLKAYTEDKDDQI